MNLTPQQKSLPLITLYLVIFFGFVGYSLMITIFTPMFLHGHGGMLSSIATVSQRTIILGILLSLYPLGQFLGSPVLGVLSDHYGRRYILIISLGLTTFFYVLIAWSLQISCLWLLMLSSFLAGLCEANIVVAQSAIADVASSADRNRLFGYIYLSASSAYIIGPLIGGKLADSNLVSWFTYATPFWAVLILLLATLVAVCFFFKETKSTLSHEKIHYFAALTNIKHIFTYKKIRVLYLSNFLFYLAIFGFFRCYPMYLVDEFHMQVSQVSEFIAWVAVPIVITNVFLTGFLSKRFSTRQLAVTSGILTGVFMILIIIPPSQMALWITLFLTSLSLAICLPSCATLLSVSVVNDEQGKVMGNNQSLQVCAESLSGIIGGLLAAIIFKLPLIILGAVAIIGALILKNSCQSKPI